MNGLTRFLECDILHDNYLCVIMKNLFILSEYFNRLGLHQLTDIATGMSHEHGHVTRISPDGSSWPTCRFRAGFVRWVFIASLIFFLTMSHDLGHMSYP